MIQVFIDTDIILDALTGRMPYAEEANQLFVMIESGKVKATTSSHSITNAYYILRKQHSHSLLVKKLSDLADLVRISGVNHSMVLNALKSDFKDFEDAVQHEYACSKNENTAIITRNIKDYRKSTLPVLTPGDFLMSGLV